MNTTTFHVVRVNTPAHSTPELGLYDMATIIERGYFWKKSDTFYCPVGSLILAMGGHGGRGLFINGIVTGEWEKEHGNGEYHYRIKMQWQEIVYQHPPEAVEAVASMLPHFNIRFGSRSITAQEFAAAFSFVASGTLINPWEHEAYAA
jgi:hypothetical protein